MWLLANTAHFFWHSAFVIDILLFQPTTSESSHYHSAAGTGKV